MQSTFVELPVNANIGVALDCIMEKVCIRSDLGNSLGITYPLVLRRDPNKTIKRFALNSCSRSVAMLTRR